jgi:putative transposase
VRRTYAFQLYRSKHLRHLHRQIDLGGVIHNHCIALHKRYYRWYGRYLSLHRLQKHLTKLKRLPQYAHWFGLGSQAIQNIAERIDFGYQKFFRKDNQRPPTFRKIRRAKSFTLKQAGWAYHGANRLRIGSHLYRFHQSRHLEGTIKTVTIKRLPTGRMMVYFSCLLDPAPPDRTLTGNMAGFDFGLQQFLTGSDGHDVTAPQPFKAALRSVRKANRRLARKQKGSGHRRQANKVLARVHRTVANRRTAWHWDTARDLCTRYDTIYLEDLTLQGMKALWGRKVSDLGLASFVSILHQAAEKMGTHVHHIDRFFPSTKTCHICHTINHHITLRDRVWTCIGCGVAHPRDRNAALTIAQEGASSCRQGHCQTTSVAVPV